MQFPFANSLRLSTIIGYWELQQFDDNPILVETAKRLVAQIDEHPFLREDIHDISVLEPVKDIVDLIISAVVPPAVSSDQIVAIFKPFSLDYFYATTPFKKLTEKAGSLANMVKHLDAEELEQKKTLAAYHAILHQIYGVELPKEQQMVLQLEDAGITKYYHLFFDPRFCQVRATSEDAPKLSPEDLNMLVEDSNNLDLWLEKISPDLFEFTGFAIYTLHEATHHEALSNIKNALQSTKKPTQDFINYLRQQFRDLAEVPDIEIGVSSYQTFRQTYDRCEEGGSMSLLVDGKNNFLKAFHDISDVIKQKREPVIIADTANSQFFEKAHPDFKSLLIIPLHSDEDFIGHLELASKDNTLGSLEYAKIAEVVPVLAAAMAKKMEELENIIQSIIKEHYTSIHPSVEWKFIEAAYNILQKREEGQKDIHEEIVFKNVYPLYASSDIRNSSVIRNDAIVSDLISQLELAKTTLRKAEEEISFPIIGETIYRLNKHLRRLKKGQMLSGDEHLIINFLQKDVEPTISDLEKDLPEFALFSKENYWNALDPELGILYKKRRNFEESLTQINESIANFLEAEEERAQRIFPHYFERYKTDGVEYNIYAGEAIARGKKFSNLYLKNLRLWQLLVTIEVARKTTELKDQLSMPLEAGHLILVHSQPLAVKFRMDEKQFDVDGAYNIRYEIIKKRIDKVHIKDSEERLTQANTISIIYNQEEDATEYLAYLEFLQHQGHIAPHFEQFELEELQGVSGLKAFRVRVEKSSKGLMKELMSLGVKDASLASSN